MKVKDFFRGAPFIAFELALVIPLLFATIMWLTFAISVPFSKYPVHGVIPPEVLVSSSIKNVKPVAIATPERLTIYPVKKGKSVVRHVIPEISASDARFLMVASDNARLTEYKDILMIEPTGSGPIVLEFRSESYRPALLLTIMAWIGLVFASIALKVFSKSQVVRD